MCRLFLILILGALGPGLLRAEKLEMRFLSWESLNTRVISYKDGSGYKDLFIRSIAQSEVYEYSGPQPIVFFTEGTGPDGKPAKVEVARADVPKDIKHPLLILFGKKLPGEASPQYDIKIVDDSFENFPFGSYGLFNLSKGTITGQIEKENFDLGPGTSQIVQLGDQTRRNIGVRFFGTVVSGPPQLWRETYWRHEPEMRTLIFIVNSSDLHTPGYTLKVIEEHSAPPTPPKP